MKTKGGEWRQSIDWDGNAHLLKETKIIKLDFYKRSKINFNQSICNPSCTEYSENEANLSQILRIGEAKWVARQKKVIFRKRLIRSLWFWFQSIERVLKDGNQYWNQIQLIDFDRKWSEMVLERSQFDQLEKIYIINWLIGLCSWLI